MADASLKRTTSAKVYFGHIWKKTVHTSSCHDVLDCAEDHCSQSQIMCVDRQCTSELRNRHKELKGSMLTLHDTKDSLDQEVVYLKHRGHVDKAKLTNTDIEVLFDLASHCQHRSFFGDRSREDCRAICIACSVELMLGVREACDEGLMQYRAYVEALRSNTIYDPTITDDESDGGRSRNETPPNSNNRPAFIRIVLEGIAGNSQQMDNTAVKQESCPSEESCASQPDDEYDLYADDVQTLQTSRKSTARKYVRTKGLAQYACLPTDHARTLREQGTLEEEKAIIRQMVVDGSNSPYARYGSYRGHGTGTLKPKDRTGMNFNGGKQGGNGGSGQGKTGKKAKRPALEGYRNGR